MREKFISSRPTMLSQPAVLQHIARACSSFRTSSVSGLGNFAHTGSSSLTVPVYSGAFDNAYFSGNGTTGNLYVCGNAGGAPSLYKITMAATFPGTISTGLAVSGTTTVHVLPSYGGLQRDQRLALPERDGPGNLSTCTTRSTGCVYNFNAVATTTGGTTIASKTVTAGTTFYQSTDVGAVISGGGIPANATIVSRGQRQFGHDISRCNSHHRLRNHHHNKDANGSECRNCGIVRRQRDHH